MLIAVVLVGIVIPRFLRGDGMPVAVSIAGQALRISVLSFFFLAVVAAPLFSSLLFLSRGGRNALGSYELRAVRWSIAPLLGGVVLLVLWIAGGGKSIPIAALGFLCASTLLYEATAQRHPWVRRRMLMVAGAASLCAVWFLLGPAWLILPLAQDLVSNLKANRQNPDTATLAEDMKRQVAEMIRVRNHFFTYPALALYIFTSYSSDLIRWLTRKAPDDVD